MIERSWDPREYGADCDNCPLKNYPLPVPCKKASAAPQKLVIIGESPGINEVAEQTPFVGASGWELDKALKASNVKRDQCHITNAISCRPKAGMSPEDWKKAIKCCKPRLDSEITNQSASAALVMGGKALQAVYGKAKITSWRGSPLKMELDGSKELSFLPTIHPANVLRKPAMRPIFQLDTSRAARLADGTLREFKWPNLYVGTGAAHDKSTVLKVLSDIADAGLPIGVDVETHGIDPLSAGLLALGVSNVNQGVSVLWDDDPEIREAFQRCFDKCECVTQNGSHDVLSLRFHKFRFTNGFDTLLAHAVVAPYLRHDLGFIFSCFYHGERWKTIAKVEKDLKGADGWEKWRDRDPEGFKMYNAKDCASTVLCLEPLKQALSTRHRGWELFNQYMRLQDICMKMKKRGVLVNQDVRRAHREKLSAEAKSIKRKFYKMIKDLGIPNIQLGKSGQHASLRNLFFGYYGFTPRSRTAKGLPKCDKDFLESIPKGEARVLARLVLQYRKRRKLLSTYINGLQYDYLNIVHPDFKCWGAITGRFASRRPNLQNQPYVMRDMFMAFPGQYFLKADYVGLEAAIVAFMAGDDGILKEYSEGQDLHMNRAREMFGDRIYSKAMKDYKEGDGSFYKRVRRMAKDSAYAIQYGALPETMWKRLRNTFPDLTLHEVRVFHERYFKAHPAIKDFHKHLEKIAFQDKYVEEPLSGRREYFTHDRVDLNKVYNFPIQACAATMMNKAIEELNRRVDWNTSGISAQVHDELNLCTVDPYKGWTDIHDSMAQLVEYNGRSFRFRVDVEIGLDLLNTEKVTSPEKALEWAKAHPAISFQK